MEFFIVIGGIILIAVWIYRNDKRAKECQAEILDESLKEHEFKNKIYDKDIQFEVDDFLKECTKKELYNRLCPILSQIKGFEYIMADFDSFLEYYTDIPPEIPRRALLAARGKISCDDYHLGMKSPQYLSCWTHKWYNAMWKRNNEFMIWMDVEFQKRGIEPMLYVDLDQTPWRVKDISPYSVAPYSDAPVANGRYYWRSLGYSVHQNIGYKL